MLTNKSGQTVLCFCKIYVKERKSGSVEKKNGCFCKICGWCLNGLYDYLNYSEDKLRASWVKYARHQIVITSKDSEQ